jgi:hypothetical protein
VGEHEAIGETPIGDQGAKAVDGRFESVGFFIVGGNYVVQVHLHHSPRRIGDFFIANVAQCAGRALLDLLDNAIGGRAAHVDPGASADIENFAKPLDAFAGMDANARFPDHGDFAVAIGLLRFAHVDLRVMAKFYQGIRVRRSEARGDEKQIPQA